MRGDLLTKKAVLAEKMGHSRRQIQDALAEDAPFHLVPSLLEKLDGQVKADAASMNRRYERDVEGQVKSKIRRKLSEPGFWPEGVNRFMMSAKILDAVGGTSGAEADVPLFGLSPDDAAKITQSIESITKNPKPFLTSLDGTRTQPNR